jgi:hypothetical protein
MSEFCRLLVIRVPCKLQTQLIEAVLHGMCEHPVRADCEAYAYEGRAGWRSRQGI